MLFSFWFYKWILNLISTIILRTWALISDYQNNEIPVTSFLGWRVVFVSIPLGVRVFGAVLDKWELWRLESHFFLLLELQLHFCSSDFLLLSPEQPVPTSQWLSPSTRKQGLDSKENRELLLQNESLGFCTVQQLFFFFPSDL